MNRPAAVRQSRELIIPSALSRNYLYQCFTDEDRKRDVLAHVEFAVSDRRIELDAIRQRHRCMGGEWSCALPAKSLPQSEGLVLEAAMRAYGAAQLLTYERTEGWFFWTYRTENGRAWSFRDCVARGWLPDKYSPARENTSS